MRRFALMLSTLVISGAYMLGPAAAQESSVFRYASDPFSAEDGEAAEGEAEEPAASGEGEQAEKESSYDSYASWPSGGKNLVQRKAMFRAQQRELRIASRQWYGYSAARPPVYGNPYYMDAHSPSLWSTPSVTSVNWASPFAWYYPRQSVSSYRWIPSTYAATYIR